MSSYLFFFNDSATTEIYTLSLHDALPISRHGRVPQGDPRRSDEPDCSRVRGRGAPVRADRGDRKSTRLNSSHTVISYAVFCLKKKKKTKITREPGAAEKATSMSPVA